MGAHQGGGGEWFSGESKSSVMQPPVQLVFTGALREIPRTREISGKLKLLTLNFEKF